MVISKIFYNCIEFLSFKFEIIYYTYTCTIYIRYIHLFLPQSPKLTNYDTTLRILFFIFCCCTCNEKLINCIENLNKYIN